MTFMNHGHMLVFMITAIHLHAGKLCVVVASELCSRVLWV